VNWNSQEIKKEAGKDKLSVLIIMFLMAALLFFLFMLMSVGKALAQPRGRGMGSRFGQGFFENDGLMPEQSDKMEKIRKDHWKEMVPLRQELGAKRLELRLLDSNSKTEADRIFSLRKDIHDLQEKIRVMNFNYRFKCQDLLPPERQDPVPSLSPGRGAGRGWAGR
jgi:Spy/CpxP family protein refolding chaperone